jgi:hypothetical protein
LATFTCAQSITGGTIHNLSNAVVAQHKTICGFEPATAMQNPTDAAPAGATFAPSPQQGSGP